MVKIAKTLARGRSDRLATLGREIADARKVVAGIEERLQDVSRPVNKAEWVGRYACWNVLAAAQQRLADLEARKLAVEAGLPESSIKAKSAAAEQAPSLTAADVQKIVKQAIERDRADVLAAVGMALGDARREIEERIDKIEARSPSPTYRGIWESGKVYAPGDGVTFGGSYWVAMAETGDKPGSSDDWKLAVKRGRDGRDGRRPA